MGLTTFKGDIPVLQDVLIAKNYLNEEELKVLNNLVSGYFDFAEIQAIRHNPMYMEDYIKQLNRIIDLEISDSNIEEAIEWFSIKIFY